MAAPQYGAGAQAILDAWKRLVQQYPALTQGVTTTPAYTGRYAAGGTPPAAADQQNRRLLFDPNYARADQAAQGYNDFVPAHELGHLDEAQQLRNADLGRLYMDIAGRQHTGQTDALGLDWATPTRNIDAPLVRMNDAAHDTGGELYASDFASALGKQSPTPSLQAHGDLLETLQFIGALPKGVGYGTGPDDGLHPTLFQLGQGQQQAVLNNYQRVLNGTPQAEGTQHGRPTAQDDNVRNYLSRFAQLRAAANGGGPDSRVYAGRFK